ncbi:DUF4270 domain-containing protein [Flavobacterium zepuense]|uniref:DUF4270 domain-containing protein n=2 Tax=Flavobacterium zepuense TaxID=2593302 RepID=A0A552UXB2_9FLAO|nr:DUF4270 domain-containing protein [Flavobacterium zepuense]
MNKRSLFIKIFLFSLSFVFMMSCDTDYDQLGSDVVDGDIHNNIIKFEPGIAAYDMPTGSVQSNNMEVNTLGAYNHPIFGTTVASFVSQLELGTTAPTFDQPVLDSVYLYVPYHSTLAVTAADGSSTYTLDSIYGDTTNAPTFRLSVKKNNFFLRDADASNNSTVAQKYYTSDRALIEGAGGESLLADDAGTAIEGVDFRYSAAEVHRKATPPGGTLKTVENLAPGMFLNLNKSIFQTLIIDAQNSGNLANNNVFKNYFRGIYFKAEQIGDNSTMAALKFASGVITMRYRDVTRTNGTIVLNDDGTIKYTYKTLLLNLKGNTINFLENTAVQPAYLAAINTSTPITGDSRLYVKGGEGSAAYIDINPNDIESLKALNSTGNGILINEANLVFYVDKAAMAGGVNDDITDPLRVFLYDVNNKRPVYDYYTDVTSVNGFPKYQKYVYGGIAEYDATDNARVARYKIRITDHINNLVNKDSTNVKLGLVVTESITITGNSAVKTPFNAGTQQVQAVPAASVMHPFGTVLFGNNIPVGDPNYDKRLKLEVYYTKPD